MRDIVVDRQRVGDARAREREPSLRLEPRYFIRDAEAHTSKLPLRIRMRMIIKGWNWRRRGNSAATRNNVTIRADEDQKVRIF